MEKIKVYINNTPYDGFTNVKFNKSFLNLASSFSATIPINTTYQKYLINNKVSSYPVSLNASVKLYIDKTIIFNGYIERLSISQSSSNIMQISGRSITADLIDTTIDNTIISKFSSDTSLKSMCSKTLAKLGIKSDVIESTPLDKFTRNDFISPQVGQSAFDFLNQYAKKRQVFLQTSGGGNIHLLRSSNKIDTGTQLVLSQGNKLNNILSSNVTYDTTKLFNKYNCRSQNNLTFDGIDVKTLQKTNTDVLSTATDDTVRSSRILNFISETNLNNKEALDRANWQKNFNKSQYFIYECTIPKLTYDGESIWDTNQLVHIIDDLADVDAKLLISSVEFSVDINDGSLCKLQLVLPDSFNLIAVDNLSNSVNNKIGETFNNG